MEKLVTTTTTQILFLSFFIFLVLHFRPAKSQEVEDEREFDYGQWSERGPARWGEIRHEWSMCSNGTMQSPIDLLDQRVKVSQLHKLKRSYKPSNATFKNRGHDIMLKWNSSEAGYIEINGTMYLLQQCHWHSPSEHTVNGKSFDLELHLVHQSHAGHLIVIGILYQIGNKSDSFLSLMEGHLTKAISNKSYNQEQVVGVVNPRLIKIGTRSYYKYIGSLTVPPCTQNVVWFVVKEIRTVAMEQVILLRVAVNDGSETNARPLQQIHGRSLQLYSDEEVNEDY